MLAEPSPPQSQDADQGVVSLVARVYSCTFRTGEIIRNDVGATSKVPDL